MQEEMQKLCTSVEKQKGYGLSMAFLMALAIQHMLHIGQERVLFAVYVKYILHFSHALCSVSKQTSVYSGYTL